MNEFKYPLFWCIPLPAQVGLMQLNYELYKTKLDIPPELTIYIDLEDIKEIDREMRKARSRG